MTEPTKIYAVNPKQDKAADAPAMHNAADELGARLGQLSALLMSAAGSGLADMDRAQRSAYLFACLRVSEECEGIVRDMPLPPL